VIIGRNEVWKTKQEMEEIRKRKTGDKKMVNVEETKLDFYSEKKEGESTPFLNVTTARQDELLNKWVTVKKAYIDEASVFNKEGQRIEGESIDKWHLDFEEIPHKMTLNKTNFETMKKDFGPETNDWVGQKVKFRVQQYSGYNPGIVIIDKQELKDMGETPPSSSSKELLEKVPSKDEDEPPVIDLSEEVNRIADQQIMKDKVGWFESLRDQLPKTKEDLEDVEKVAAEWINRIRNDLIGSGVKNVSTKVIRDNVAVMVEQNETSETDLGKLDENMGREIFKLLRQVDVV
jgi:hypothetical protein